MTPDARLKLALAVSMALNLFVLGAAAGAYLANTSATRRATEAARAAPSLWSTAEVLGPRDREAFRELLRTRARALAPEVRANREARREASRLVGAPAYDAAAARAALANLRARELRVRTEVDATLIDYLARLAPTDRAALADAVVRGRLGPVNRPEPAATPRSATAPPAPAPG